MISAADRLAVAAAPWPLLAICASPRFARLYRRSAAIAAGYLVLYALAAVGVAVVAPWRLIPWAIVAAVASVFLLWRSRSGSGRAHRLPPGPLRPLPVRPVTDHDFVAKHIAKYGPISKVAMPHVAHPLVLVSGLARGAAVLRANDSRLQWVGMSFDALIPAGFIRSMNPDDHRHYIRIFRESFGDRVVDACRPSFAAIARIEVERMNARANGSVEGVDPRPSLGRYALASLARLFLGIEDGDELALVERLYDDPGPLTVEWGADQGTLRRAAEDATAIVRQQAATIDEVSARGEEPPLSFLSELVHERPEAIHDQNVALNLAFLLGTTFRDVTGLLHWAVKLLGDNPGWTDRLRDGCIEDDLASRVVLETLRLEQSEYIQRRVLETFEVDDFVVPAGWYLRVCVRESHRDPAVFVDPELFDPDRFLGTRHTREEYSPLGMTNRPCIGAATTVAIVGAFVAELARGWEWALVRDGSAEFDGYHWRPSRRLRIRIGPLARLSGSRVAAGVAN